MLQLKPLESLKYTFMLVRILNSFSIFNNSHPLQKPVQSLILEGFDLYDSQTTPNLNPFGTVLSAAATLVCLPKGYFALDYLQSVFVLSLVSVHYPRSLQSFLASFIVSNLQFRVTQFEAPSLYKFQTVVKNMSLLGNMLYIFVFIAAYLLMLGTLHLANYIL